MGTVGLMGVRELMVIMSCAESETSGVEAERVQGRGSGKLRKRPLSVPRTSKRKIRNRKRKSPAEGGILVM